MINYTAENLAKQFGGTVLGDKARLVTNFAKIEEAQEHELSFLANPKYEKYLAQTKAGVVLVKDNYAPNFECAATLVQVADPYMAFAAILQAFDAGKYAGLTGIDKQTSIDSNVAVDGNVFVGAFTSIASGTKIGEASKIFQHVTIGNDVSIGNNVIIYPNVTIYNGCIIGNNVIIHAGAVIGSDGFGFVPDERGVYHKIPQVGHVVIQDYVEIGANTVVDRATLGATLIQKGVKLDNLVQVAHNVVIGEHTAVAAQAGISGSTKIGDRCLIGGQAGFVGHIEIESGNRFQAKSGVGKSIKEKNGAWAGAPAFDYQQNLKSQVIFRNLPALEKRVRELENQLKALKEGEDL